MLKNLKLFLDRPGMSAMSKNVYQQSTNSQQKGLNMRITNLTEDDIREIKAMTLELKQAKGVPIKDVVVKTFIEDHPDKREDRYASTFPARDIVSHAWISAVLLYLKVNGYKVTKE